MKKLTALIAIVMSTQVYASDGAIKNDKRFGCTEESHYRELAQYAALGDEGAFMTSIRPKAVAGHCMMFKKGTPVFVMDNAGALIKIRQVGGTKTYWTGVQSIL